MQMCWKLRLNVNSDEANFMKFLLQIQFMAYTLYILYVEKKFMTFST